MINFLAKRAAIGLWVIVLTAAPGAGYLAYLGSRSDAKPPPASPQSGRLVVGPDSRDFGTVRRGEVVTAAFTLRSTHPVAVTCGPITKGCSCSSATVEPKTIPPGGEGTLIVVWNLAGKRGRSTEVALVSYAGSGGLTGSTAARVLANVVGAVEPDRDGLDLDAANRTDEVVFRSPSGRAFRCVGAGTSHPSLTAAVDPRGDRVRVSFDPAVSGWEYGRLYVTVVTDCAEDREVRVDVRVNKGS